MSEKDLPRFLIMSLNILAATLVILTVKFSTVCGSHTPSVYIAAKEVFSTVCVDGSGNQYNHNEEWTESTGSCDRRICVAESAEPVSYLLKYDCPPAIDYLDVDNCQYVSNSALAFPDCCPELQCSNGTGVTENNPACYDRSPTLTCVFWQTETNCVDSANSKLSLLFTLQQDYCRKTCGFC